jgi:transcription elongation factor GreA-like protein
LSSAHLIKGKNIYPGLQVVGPHAFQNYISKEFEVTAIDGLFPADNKTHQSRNSLAFKYLTCYNLNKKTEKYLTISNTHKTKHWREYHI